MNRKEIAKRFSEEVLKRSGNEIVSITLFGSVAEGIDTTDSDIDILVITDADQNISNDICDVVADFVIRYSELPSILVYPLNNMSEFAKKIVRGGVVIYERDRSALINPQIITPRLGDATRELQEKTAGFSLQEVFDGAKSVERGDVGCGLRRNTLSI